MKFEPQNFRTIGEDNKPHFKIRTHAGSTLILVKKSGEAWYGRTRADKDHLVEQFEPEDLLLWAWVGQNHTDIFLLTKKDIEKHYA